MIKLSCDSCSWTQQAQLPVCRLTNDEFVCVVMNGAQIAKQDVNAALFQLSLRLKCMDRDKHVFMIQPCAFEHASFVCVLDSDQFCFRPACCEAFTAHWNLQHQIKNIRLHSSNDPLIVPIMPRGSTCRPRSRAVI